MQTEVKEKPVYAVAASVQLPQVSDIEFEASLAELRELAKTLGYTVVRTFIQKRGSFGMPRRTRRGLQTGICQGLMILHGR